MLLISKDSDIYDIKSGSFFSVRHKLPGYLANVFGFFSKEEFRALCNYSTRDDPHPEKTLHPAGDGVIQRYTSGSCWAHL